MSCSKSGIDYTKWDTLRDSDDEQSLPHRSGPEQLSLEELLPMDEDECQFPACVSCCTPFNGKEGDICDVGYDDCFGEDPTRDFFETMLKENPSSVAAKNYFSKLQCGHM